MSVYVPGRVLLQFRGGVISIGLDHIVTVGPTRQRRVDDDFTVEECRVALVSDDEIMCIGSQDHVLQLLAEARLASPPGTGALVDAITHKVEQQTAALAAAVAAYTPAEE